MSVQTQIPDSQSCSSSWRNFGDLKTELATALPPSWVSNTAPCSGVKFTFLPSALQEDVAPKILLNAKSNGGPLLGKTRPTDTTLTSTCTGTTGRSSYIRIPLTPLCSRGRFDILFSLECENWSVRREHADDMNCSRRAVLRRPYDGVSGDTTALVRFIF